jgi:metal-dependent amidase/aminoacylase/carboxypeptidase family protein
MASPPPIPQSVLDVAALEAAPGLVALRRDIHQHPELAGDERRTAALVAQRLRAAGLDVRTGVGGHGVVAVVEGANPGRTIAYRADMDAVPDDERSGLSFASRVPGAAHLCGHDLHTTIGVGVAEVLARRRERLAGRIVLVFQPAEETLEGARAMLDAGALDDPLPEEIYALHCAPLLVGLFAALPGAGQPGLDTFTVHAAPGAGAGSLRRLADQVSALSTIDFPTSPRDLDELLDAMRLADGPLSRFVLARAWPVDGPEPRVEGWVRTWPDDRFAVVREDLRRLAGPGATVEHPGPPFPAMVCSPELSLAAAAHLRDVLGPGAVIELRAPFPFNGEDFALFLRRVPGAMLFLGVADASSGANGVPHSPDFAADERAIGVGVRAMSSLLVARAGRTG